MELNIETIEREGMGYKELDKLNWENEIEDFGRKAVPYILDSSKLNVSEEELCYCIQEQLYDHKQ